MATRIPLIVNASAYQIQELPTGDSLTGIATLTATTLVCTSAQSTNLNVTGITTIVTLDATSLRSTNLNVTGISTIATLTATSLQSTNLNVTGISTVANLTSQNINSSGIITATSFVKSAGTSSQFLKADGSSDSTSYTSAASFTGTNQDFVGTSGYQKFPGGMIMQWGQSSSLGQSSETQTFATPFTTAVFSVVATPNGGGGNPGDKRDHWVAQSWTLNNFTLVSYFESGSASYSWIAIGY